MARRQAPLVLTVPDLDGAGPGHWLSRWEAQDSNVRRVDMVDWSEPNRNLWVNRLNLAIHRAGRPVVLVAHGVGCLTVAWWAHYEMPKWAYPVLGALLVSPPDVDGAASDPRQLVFSPTPLGPLPFPSTVIAASGIARAARLASFWGSELVDASNHGDDDAIGGWMRERQLVAGIARRAAIGLTPMRPIEPMMFAL
jgi:predicted alpha/beta hydrolase family esterase